MENFLIRAMEQKDIDQIVEIEKIVFPSPWSKASIEAELSDNNLANYLVLVKDNEEETVMAYCGVWKILDEGHITNVAVHPVYQGHHYGRFLMAAMINWCKDNEINHMTLEVRPSNEKAIKMYSHFGFTEAGRRKAYYEDNGEDAIIMWVHFEDN